MMDEQLRNLLGQIDPLPGDESFDSPRYRTLMEAIMNTPLDTEPNAADTKFAAEPLRRLSWRRSPVFIGSAAAALIAVAISVAVVTRDSSSTSEQSLSIADAGISLGSCVPFDVSVLAAMPVAFAGTATEITDTTVTLTVDRWFTTDTVETDLVNIALPPGNTSAALDGVDFVTGDRYLVTATGGTVNGCGFSGQATPELEASFEAAFGS